MIANAEKTWPNWDWLDVLGHDFGNHARWFRP